MKHFFFRLSSILILLIVISCSKDSPPPPPPGNASQVYPEKNKTCESGTVLSPTTSEVNFQWTISENTDYYELVITNLNTNLATTISNIKSNSYKMVLNSAIPYSWKVVSKSTQNVTTTGTSAIWNFYLAGAGITNYTPYPAAIVSPKPGSTVVANSGKVTLNWTGADPENDVLKFTVYCDEVDGKQTPLAANTLIATNIAEIAVQSGKTYYWRIKSQDAQNASYTIVYSFKVQ